jgi:type II secretory pathway predicted ATPase ExeA
MAQDPAMSAPQAAGAQTAPLVLGAPQSQERAPLDDGLQPPALHAAHFGFALAPFALSPDPDMMLWSPGFRRALSVLDYGHASGAPLTLLVGGIGCGKSTLLRAFLEKLEPNVTVALISNAQGGRGDLLQWVLNALGQSFDPGASYVSLFQALQDALIAEYARGQRCLLIFDEAQNLSAESLEELRMLTNINFGKDLVLQILLSGQPELEALIRRPGLEQLAQRIAVSARLGPLDAPTTAEFIAHRLRRAGGTGAEFTPEAMAEIHARTGGVPRLITQFCDIALLYGATAEVREIGPDILAQVLEDGIFFAVQPAAPSLPSSGDAR